MARVIQSIRLLLTGAIQILGYGQVAPIEITPSGDNVGVKYVMRGTEAQAREFSQAFLVVLSALGLTVYASYTLETLQGYKDWHIATLTWAIHNVDNTPTSGPRGIAGISNE